MKPAADRTKTGPAPKREDQRRARKRAIPVGQRKAWVARVFERIAW